MRGSMLLGEAAIRSGCRAYFGYPITPQNELPEYMASAFAKMDDAVFVQAESALASIKHGDGRQHRWSKGDDLVNQPGISLKQEGYPICGDGAAGCHRQHDAWRTRLGNIAPAQGDYFQATKEAGHGDYH